MAFLLIAAWACVTPGCLIPSTSACVGDARDCTIFNYSVPAGCPPSSGCSTFARCIRANCSTIRDLAACGNTPGCKPYAPNNACEFDSDNDPCDGETESACALLPSCQWGNFCGGRTHACPTLSSESACEASYYCDWQTNSN